MDRFLILIYSFLLWFLTITFIFFYPMLISIYVFLPLFIGVVGYLFIIGIQRHKWHYVLLAVIYFVNLEINLSLPLFLMILSTFIVYALFYTRLSQMRWCRVCAKIILVFLLDSFYLGSLLGYDFIFESTSVGLDILLVYSLVIDMMVVILL